MLTSLRMRMFAILLAPIGLSVILFCAIAFNILQANYTTLVADRLSAVAHDIRDVLEGSLNLGLPLTAVQETQALIERERARNLGISSIVVFGEGGRGLFSTDPQIVGDQIPGDWLPERGLETQPWIRFRNDEVVIGAPIVNSFQQPVGGVLIRVARAYFSFRKVEAFKPVAAVAGIFTLLAAGAAFVTAGLLTRDLREHLDATARGVERLRAAETQEEIERSVETSPALKPFGEAVGRTVGLLREASRTVTHLDETA